MQNFSEPSRGCRVVAATAAHMVWHLNLELTMSKEKTVVHNGGSGWFVATLLAIVIAGTGYYLYETGAFSDEKEINNTIDVPDTPKS